MSGLNTTSTSPSTSPSTTSNIDNLDPSQPNPKEQGDTAETPGPAAATEAEAEYDYNDNDDYDVDDTNYEDDVDDVSYDYNEGPDDDVVSDDYDQTEYIDDSEDYFNVETPVDLPLGYIEY